MKLVFRAGTSVLVEFTCHSMCEQFAYFFTCACMHSFYKKKTKKQKKKHELSIFAHRTRPTVSGWFDRVGYLNLGDVHSIRTRYNP